MQIKQMKVNISYKDPVGKDVGKNTYSIRMLENLPFFSDHTPYRDVLLVLRNWIKTPIEIGRKSLK